MDELPTVDGVTTTEEEDVDTYLFEDSVLVVPGMSDEVDDVCSDEVTAMDVSPTVEAVESAEVEDVNIAIVVDPVVVLGK